MLLEICSKIARNVKYCSNVAQSAKKRWMLKMQNCAPNSKKCSKDAQRNWERQKKREKVKYGLVLAFLVLVLIYNDKKRKKKHYIELF